MSESLPLWIHVFRALVQFAFFLVATALLIWGERRLVARMQSRYGPNRVGPLGILQTAVDGLKLFFKEDVRPSMVDKPVYLLAPLISVIVAFLAWAVVPIGGTVTIGEHTFALQVADLDVGLLWFLAMGSINVYGIVLAGWSSQSAYPLMGGIRSSAQMVSYEIAQGLALASVFIYAGTLTVSEIVAQQSFQEGLIAGVPNWFAIPLFPAFIIFFFGMVAETQRPPFDMPEAEGELVGGFHTEYSGMKFAMFFLAEFMNVITVSAIAVTTFFGGTSGPVFGPGWLETWVLPSFWFVLKTFVFVFIFVLLRASLPRIRYDQLMRLGWKLVIPVGLVWVLATAAMVVLNDTEASSTRFIVAGIGGAFALGLYALAPMLSREDEEVAA